MKSEEYVDVIKLALRMSSMSLSIHLHERVTERTNEDWVISCISGNLPLPIRVDCGSERFLKKLRKILKEADIAHDPDENVPLRLTVWGWKISNHRKSIQT